MNIVEFPSKPTSATITLPFDFTSSIPSGVSINSAISTIIVWSGVDSDANTVLDGNTIISGLQVSQVVTGGINGVVYLITILATGSDANVYPLSGYLAVTTDYF